MESFDETRILLATESMPSWKRVAFMAYCCERMLPNYRSFQADAGYGDETPMRNALDAVWGWIATDRMPSDVTALASSCERQSPETSEFSSIYTSAALDSATATITTLEAMTEATVMRVIEVATLARDTVDLFVQEQEGLDPNSPNLERKITEHALMQAELSTQRESLKALSDLNKKREEAGIALQANWSKLTRGSLPVQ